MKEDLIPIRAGLYEPFLDKLDYLDIILLFFFSTLLSLGLNGNFEFS